MRNGQPVTWTCSIEKECAVCGERYWCWSDEELEKIDAEYKTFKSKEEAKT